ncbi:hypothetical protein ZIOFF_005549 [Zingiber officinale]|uniref:Digalactosyldiacylglycerol synthase 1, chloroplastic n=1 Tax=Zingiber officinale TaxID=94328 RepID=A0A8J5HVP6_ZINOF|nr:hypothetical protein ZIOFF_005549 [Zingiber officinale]
MYCRAGRSTEQSCKSTKRQSDRFVLQHDRSTLQSDRAASLRCRVIDLVDQHCRAAGLADQRCRGIDQTSAWIQRLTVIPTKHWRSLPTECHPISITGTLLSRSYTTEEEGNEGGELLLVLLHLKRGGTQRCWEFLELGTRQRMRAALLSLPSTSVASRATDLGLNAHGRFNSGEYYLTLRNILSRVPTGRKHLTNPDPPCHPTRDKCGSFSLSGTNTTPFALVDKPSVPSSRTMLGRGAESAPSPGAGTAEKALSFISRGWREVRDNADADLRLMRARASSFKSLADRELENFFSFPSAGLAFSSPSELEIVKRIKPKLSELQQAYSARDLSRRVLEKWAPKSTIRIDMSSIRSVIVSEVDEMGEIFGLGGDGARSQKRVLWKGEAQEEQVKEWDPIRILKMCLKGLERKSQSTSNELVEKVKLSLEILPLDLPELLAYLVKQSGPLFDHLGIQRDTCNKIIEALCRRHKDHLVSHSLSAKEASLIDENIDYLDLRIASVLESTGHHYEGGFWTNLLEHKTTDKKRHVAIVTTASLPWMTGTAVNPLFRAAYMAKSAKQDVTLVVPWLCKSDQDLVYPNSLRFISPEEQEAYIRNWLEDRIGFKTDFKISFYPGKFSRERRSIIPAGDTTQFIPSKEADIAILEEPEHLNWYHHGKRWTDKFNYVVGVVHTNYLEYIKRQKNGAIQAFFVKHINNWVTRAYCDKA